MSLVNMKTKETFKHAIKVKLENDLNSKRDDLNKSILGTLKSSHLNYNSYNLDMHYIMHQKVQEYKLEKSKPYSQFVTGMVPDKILKDLNKLELQQIFDKQQGMKPQQGKMSKSNILEQSDVQQITAEQLDDIFIEEPVIQSDIQKTEENSLLQSQEKIDSKETSVQKQMRKWTEMRNNSVDFISANKNSPVYKMILQMNK